MFCFIQYKLKLFIHKEISICLFISFYICFNLKIFILHILYILYIFYIYYKLLKSIFNINKSRLSFIIFFFNIIIFLWFYSYNLLILSLQLITYNSLILNSIILLHINLFYKRILNNYKKDLYNYINFFNFF